MTNREELSHSPSPHKGWTGVARMPLLSAVAALILTPWRGSYLMIGLGLTFILIGLRETRKVYAFRHSPVPQEDHQDVVNSWTNAQLAGATPLILSSEPHTLRYVIFVYALTLVCVLYRIIPREPDNPIINRDV